jgi:hypothetical protein
LFISGDHGTTTLHRLPTDHIDLKCRSWSNIIDMKHDAMGTLYQFLNHYLPVVTLKSESGYVEACARSHGVSSKQIE